MDKPRHPLRDWRKAHGVTLTTLAERVGVTQSHLSEIENWKNEPSLELAARLAAESGIQIGSFVKPSAVAEAAQ